MGAKTIKIISVNVGLNQIIKWKGKDIHTSIFKYPQQKPLMLRSVGLDNDNQSDKKYHGGPDRAVYGMDIRYYDFWKDDKICEELHFGGFGENLSMAGLSDNEAMIGDVYGNDQVVVRVSGPRMPCYKLNIRYRRMHVLKKFIDLQMFGIYFAVEQEGLVIPGSELRLIERKQENLTVHELGLLLSKQQKDDAKLQYALNLSYLSEDYKKSLLKV